MSIAWYKGAAENLGLPALLRLQWAKLFRKAQPLVRAHSKHLKHPVWCRNGTSDMLVFDQIFIEREYRCIDALRDLDLILDCGANVGYSSAYFLSRFPNAFVIAVEPDAKNFALLEKNLAPYAGRFLALRAAIWSERTTLRFDQETMGDQLEWGRTVSEKNSTGDEVEAIDIDSLVKQSGRERISLLKVDIEGAELEVFSRNYAGWLGRTDNFVIEVHGPECERVLEAALRGRNYELSTCGELTVGIGRG